MQIVVDAMCTAYYDSPINSYVNITQAVYGEISRSECVLCMDVNVVNRDDTDYKTDSRQFLDRLLLKSSQSNHIHNNTNYHKLIFY